MQFNIARHAKAAKDSESHRRRSAARHSKLALAFELDYLPVCGNAATMMCFVLSVLLNVRYLDGTVYCVVVFAPVMLLLSSGRRMLRDLNDSNRYAPVASAVFVSSSIAAVTELVDIFRHGTESDYMRAINEEQLHGEESTIWIVVVKVKGQR